MTSQTATTYRTREDAARAWAAGRGITGRTGGYLGTDGFATYDALPKWLQGRFKGGRTDAVARAAHNARVKFMLFAAAPRLGNGNPRCIQGWSSLADVLVFRMEIRQIGGREWIVTG